MNNQNEFILTEENDDLYKNNLRSLMKSVLLSILEIRPSALWTLNKFIPSLNINAKKEII